MSEIFDFVDDPLATEHDGKGLIGTLQVDDDGVKPEKITLVEAGKLVTLPMSRIPTRTVKETNGHARGPLGSSPSGSPTNVFITCREGVSDEALKAKLIELCKEEDLEYGLLVKSLVGGGGRIGSPGVAYKVYVEDGREEAVRGIVFTGVELRALRDVVAAGESRKVHNMLFNSLLPISVISPSILLEEMDVKTVPPQTEKRPYLERPPLGE